MVRSACVLTAVASALASLAACRAAAQAPSAPAREPPQAEAAPPEANGLGASELHPPRILFSPSPEYPAGRAAEGLHPAVVVEVTLDARGKVTDVRVGHSADDDFDRAALQAVRTWRFAPARRGEQPIASRVRVAVHFELPAFEVAVPVPHSTPEASAAPLDSRASDARAPDTRADTAAFGVTPTAPETSGSYEARGVAEEIRMRPEDRGPTTLLLERKVLTAAPREEGAEILRSAPGVFIARPEGEAVGHRIMLRGFDAEHGQDLELRLSGVPLNLPSHIHGQGYVDLGWVIPEVVRSMHVTEGVYDPRQGDFAVAGSIELELGVPRPGTLLKSSYGAFGTFRQLGVWAPAGSPKGSFGAFQLRSSDGFGDARASQSASALMQSVAAVGAWRVRALALLYGARAQMAGVLRRDDIDSGRVDYYGVYPFATARHQNGMAARLIASVRAEYRGEAGDNGDTSLWFSYDNFRLQQNFTGFTQRSRTLANVAGRGDLIEQQNRTASFGLESRYRTAPAALASEVQAQLELGLSGRLDLIEQAQNLLAVVPRNETWDRRVDAGVRAADVGMFGEVELALIERVKWRAGLRADLLYYEVEDRLGNFAPLIRPATIVGFRRSALGLAWGPRTSLNLDLGAGVSLLAAYGQGYRSPQARTLEDGEQAPFTKVHSSDLGVRWRPSERFELTAAGYLTGLSDDLAFEPAEGRLSRVGRSRRRGGTLYAKATPSDALVAALSLTMVDAELLEPPTPTRHEPQPAFTRGQSLPYVPPLVLRLDLGASPYLKQRLGAHPLRGRFGTGLSVLSARPLPYGTFASAFATLDLRAGLDWGPLVLSLSVFNALDVRYAAMEFYFPSSWDPGGPSSRVPARHLAAGRPRSWLLSLGVEL